MQVYLQVKQGRVAVDGQTLTSPKPRPLDNNSTVALYPDSACAILIGAEVEVPTGVLLVCLDEEEDAGPCSSRVFVGEPVACFSSVPPASPCRGAVVLETYFPENCSLRRLCEAVAGSPAYELQTPEGAVVLATAVKGAEQLKAA